ncbi:chemotaxis protein CheW [Leisingera aquaemixtae]|uniref:chemotaxis protein CheW n=1 Tax=Leisingera aquaemixtae TaxID=1396826 RepID=UPI001C97B48C|nr:chemotaxis protein CheW [Leisingera aquaemixtae]MBY6066694.1 chemotaxis protein CheW [Leisingera aquaemixtae]
MKPDISDPLIPGSHALTVDGGDCAGSSGQEGDAVRQRSAMRPGGRTGQGLAEKYGSFLIGDSEFAIPVSVLQEVVNEPGDISPVPLAPPYMLGLFNLRGMIVPVVDLRKLLDFPAAESGQSRKVAIIEHGEHCIGLLFDRTGEVLNARGVARVDFRPNGKGVRDVVISGVLKFDSGERLVQILDPHELLNLEKVPRADNGSGQETVKFSRGKKLACVSFQTGHTVCAIDLRYVKEVKTVPKLEQSLLAGGNVIGTANLRGIILPVIDFRGFMGDDAKFVLGETLPKERRMLVIDTAEGPVGLMVFSIDSILSYYGDEVLPFAKLALPRGDLVNGCLIGKNNQIVMMLDPEKLMQEPSFLAAAKSCQEIFPPEAPDGEAAELEARAARRTFIKFTFERRFALDTSHVSEVINRPTDLLEPPFSLNFVEGILNLRGDLITVFNPRVLYGLPVKPCQDQKVLIFRQGAQKFGILVDSVDEIIITTESRVAELKPLDQQNTSKSIAEDVAGCLQHTSPDGKYESILILDTSALVERCFKAA